MTALPPTEHPQSPTSPDPNLTNFPGGAVPLLRRVLRQIESWQWSLKCGHGSLVQESMAEAGCEIDDFLDRGEECARK